MRLLLDTHILLWALDGNPRLGAVARDWIEDPTNDVMFSAASIWEIAIKAALHRDGFGVSPMRIAEAARAAGLVELPVTAVASASVADLPLHHRDPFDRLLVAQAATAGLQLLTADALLPPYGTMVTWLPA